MSDAPKVHWKFRRESDSLEDDLKSGRSAISPAEVNNNLIHHMVTNGRHLTINKYLVRDLRIFCAINRV